MRDVMDFGKPLDQMNREETEYFKMETIDIAEKLAERYARKGPNFLLAISLNLKDMALARMPKGE